MPRVAAWDEHHDAWQRVLNARPIPARTAQRDLDPPARVHVTLQWERDGHETRETEAVAWAGRNILVRVTDRRLQIGWVWLDAADVVRI